MLIAKQDQKVKAFFSFQSLFFLLTLFIARGLPTGEAIRVTLLIASQTYVGATIWRRLTITNGVNIIELLAAGFALGSAMFTIIDQGLIFLGLATNDALVPCILIVIALATDRLRRNSGEISQISQDDLVSLLIVTICVFLGFGELFHGSFIAVVILISTCILIINRNMSLLKSVALSAIGLGTAVFAFSLVKPPITYVFETIVYKNRRCRF